MTLKVKNPEELPTPESYTQVVAATATALIIAGQMAEDAGAMLSVPATWPPRPARCSPMSAALSQPLEPHLTR